MEWRLRRLQYYNGPSFSQIAWIQLFFRSMKQRTTRCNPMPWHLPVHTGDIPHFGCTLDVERSCVYLEKKTRHEVHFWIEYLNTDWLSTYAADQCYSEKVTCESFFKFFLSEPLLSMKLKQHLMQCYKIIASYFIGVSGDLGFCDLIHHAFIMSFFGPPPPFLPPESYNQGMCRQNHYLSSNRLLS